MLFLSIGLFSATSNTSYAQQKSAIPPGFYSIIRMPDSKAKVDSILTFTSHYRKNQSIDTLYKIAFKVIDNINYTTIKAKMLDAYGVFKRDMAAYAEAIDLHKQSLALAKKDNDVKTEIKALNNIGVVFRRLDENAEALSYHINALKLAEKVGDEFSVSVAMNSIGNIHLVLGNYADAITYFQQCLPIAKAAGNNLGIAMNYNNIGEAYEYMGQLDSANKFYEASLFFNNKIGDMRGISICYNALGNVLKKQNKPDEAIILLKKAQAINLDLGDGLYNANNFNSLGNAYLMQNEFDSSRIMFFNALALAKNIGSKTESKTAYEGLMHLNEVTHRPDSALFYSKLFKGISDSINYESNNRHVRQMEAIYNNEKEQVHISLLENKQRSDRIFLFGSFILFLLILISGLLFYLRNRLIERNRRLQQRLKIRNEIASDLHDDMGSTLSSIYIFSELLRKGGANTEDLLTKIQINAKETMDALDDIIWLVKPTNDKFSNLCEHISNYAIPMFESKEIQFEIDFPDAISEIPLPMDTRRNIFLIIKECVNNLVKYSQCTRASIKAWTDDLMIHFEVWDNGVGFDPEKLTNRSGLKNIKSRAAIMGANISIDSASGKGTTTAFWLKRFRY